MESVLTNTKNAQVDSFAEKHSDNTDSIVISTSPQNPQIYKGDNLINIKIIPTKYNKYIFRSRLEARWAVYFDKIGLQWDYEQEGYILSNGKYYLPDFFIPGFGYIEIKPLGKIKEEEKEKCCLLSQNLETNVALLEGSPDRKSYMSWNTGEKGCAISFSSYTVRKWKQTPAFTGGKHLEESSYFEEDDYSHQYANAYKFGEK